MSEQCTNCNATMGTDEGCDPTEICHNCAHVLLADAQAQIEALKGEVGQLQNERCDLKVDLLTANCQRDYFKSKLSAAMAVVQNYKDVRDGYGNYSADGLEAKNG